MGILLDKIQNNFFVVKSKKAGVFILILKRRYCFIKKLYPYALNVIYNLFRRYMALKIRFKKIAFKKFVRIGLIMVKTDYIFRIYALKYIYFRKKWVLDRKKFNLV